MNFTPIAAGLLAALFALSACTGDSSSPIVARNFETDRRNLTPVTVDGVEYRRNEVTSTYDNGDSFVDEYVYVQGRRFRCDEDCEAAVRRGLQDVANEDDGGGGGSY